jgi:hypothetical protein
LEGATTPGLLLHSSVIVKVNLNSHLAPVALPARELIPCVIAKVLSRGLKAYRARISVHFNELKL